MRLTLVSNHSELEVRDKARFTYACVGHPSRNRRSPFCKRTIFKGDQYVARVAWRTASGRAVPRLKVDVDKHCVHCALAYFVDIKIASANGESVMKQEDDLLRKDWVA